jgi:hypothetical protein
MRRACLVLGLVATVAAVGGVSLWQSSPTPAQPPSGPEAPVVPAAPRPVLPLAQVVLFNSGVGYFQREGTVEGDTRVDLSFPAGEVDDLLKSLVLQELGSGRVSGVTYDSPEPVERTLKSFAVDLTYNPTLGQLLFQARGEKVELSLQQNAGAAGTVSGVIVSLETQRQPNGANPPLEVEVLNLLCTEGLRSFPLAQVQRFRFLNAALDAEFRRALEVLATQHDGQKKTVSLSFRGEGRRVVKVGYVVENPVWKTSYRLVLGKDEKPALQGWAVVENTSDEDWKDVRMALVSGRPLSFRMDLYQPLFVPRPVVEPSRFATLRPPGYAGPLGAGQGGGGYFGNSGGAAQFGNFGGAGQWGGGSPGGGRQGGLNAGLNGGLNLGFNLGLQGGGNPDDSVGNPRPPGDDRLTFEELQRRREQQREAREQAAKVGAAVAGLDATDGVTALASSEEVGDYFQYALEDRVTLPRQKSAMLPVVTQTVLGSRVSVYNPAVNARNPLLAVRFKNTTGQTLLEGPVSVFDGGVYAGDALLPDLQPTEERLVSYAIDQGTEVKTAAKTLPEHLVAVKMVKGVLRATSTRREVHTYALKNRSPHDRVVLLQQPVRPDWKLVAPEKAPGTFRGLYLFEVKAPAGKVVEYEVTEEKTDTGDYPARGVTDGWLRELGADAPVSAKVREAVQKVFDERARVAAVHAEIGQLDRQAAKVRDDQTRVRANLASVPVNSEPHKLWLAKVAKQEEEIDKLDATLEEKRKQEATLEKELSVLLEGLNAD